MLKKASLEKKDSFISYTEPTLTDEVVYKSDRFLLRKIWTWDIVSADEDDETGLIHCCVNDSYLGGWLYTYITPVGKRLSYKNYTYNDDFHGGLSWARDETGKYGLLDKKLNEITQFSYELPENEENEDGFVNVIKDGEALLLNKKGKEIHVKTNGNYIKTTKIRRYGNLWVATVLDKNNQTKDFIIDTKGNLITDKYDCTADYDEYEFVGDLTFVSQKIDNKWFRGALDRSFKEVIPCKFECLEPLINYSDSGEDMCVNIVKATIDGKACIINDKGKQLTEVMFGDIGWDYCDGMFTFYNEYYWPYNDTHTPVGLYDMKERKVIFEPQFDDFEFLNRNLFRIVDNKKEKTVKIIDLAGNVILEDKDLYYAYETDGYYKLCFSCDGNHYNALLDKDFNEIIPKSVKIDIAKIYFDEKKFTFKKNGKIGLMSFDLKTIIEPKYENLHRLSDKNNLYDLYLAKLNGIVGIITSDEKVVVPFKYYNVSLCRDNRIICNLTYDQVEMYQIEATTKPKGMQKKAVHLKE